MIHPTAVVDDRAVLAGDVEVGAYTVIGPDVEIGSGCVIGPHVVIKGPTKIGVGNNIAQFSSIGEDPQDLKFSGETTYLEIGNHNTIREFCTLNRGTASGGGITRIGDNNLLMAYCHIAHDCQLGSHIIMANTSGLAGHVVVENYVRLGGLTAVHQFCRLGRHAFTGMGSVINRDVPPFTLVSGSYATAVGINKEGLKRADFSDDVIRALHQSFRALIFSKRPYVQAVAEIKPLIKAFDEVAEFVAFIEASQRGVVRSR